MVTIKDVARAAGVSVATVSRVFNDSLLVRGATRARVREVAQRFGYSPHGVARSLVTRRTHAIGVLLPDLYGEFFSELIRGLDQAAQARGFHLLLSSAQHYGPAFEAALRAMRGWVDGLVVMAPDVDAEFQRHLPEGFPVALINCPPNGRPIDRFAVGNFAGARAMVRHLVGLGHRRIAMLRGAEGNYDAGERLRGYRAALREAGLNPDATLELPGDFRESGGHEAARKILAMADRPTAVFAANDLMAISAISAFREGGLRVPDDVAVGGFDDIPMARYVDPPLTSVHVDICALGERATSRLLDVLLEPRPRRPCRETLPATLVVRRSCGAGRG
jgi:LacI family transcriptional regulator